jgi:hypothetical protein
MNALNVKRVYCKVNNYIVKLKCHNISSFYMLNSMVLHPVARVSQKFVQLHRTQPLFIVSHSFILILITLHVSAHFSGHLQA